MRTPTAYRRLRIQPQSLLCSLAMRRVHRKREKKTSALLDGYSPRCEYCPNIVITDNMFPHALNLYYIFRCALARQNFVFFFTPSTFEHPLYEGASLFSIGPIALTWAVAKQLAKTAILSHPGTVEKGIEGLNFSFGVYITFTLPQRNVIILHAYAVAERN